jgi:hypothetical protein
LSVFCAGFFAIFFGFCEPFTIVSSASGERGILACGTDGRSMICRTGQRAC